MFEFSQFPKYNTEDTFTDQRKKSEDYTVVVNGRDVPVYTCRISKYPFNTVFTGTQRPVNQTEEVSFINLVGDEELDFTVTANYEFDRIMLKPYSKEIKTERDGNKIKFKINKNGHYVLELNDYHRLLYIFYTEYIPCEDKSKVTYYFGKGVHFRQYINLKDNDVIYLEKDALVYGNIYGRDVKNIKIYGNGIFDDGSEERTGTHCYADFIIGNVKFVNCENVLVKGIGFTNSAMWCSNIFHSFNVTFDNVKIFGEWKYNTDGIDIVNSQHVFIKNSFVHSFDDTITIKGIDRFSQTNCEDIHVDNCVLWCDWGKTCELGLETACKEYKNISFRNIDVLRSGNTVCDIQNGDNAEVHDVVFENINAEYNVFDTLEQYQGSPEEVYVNVDKHAGPHIVNFVNFRFRNNEMYKDMFPEGFVPPVGMEACIHDIVVRNVNVYYDEGIPYKDGKPNAYIYVSSTEKVAFYNIYLENIRINGKRLNKDNALLFVNNTENFELK